MSADKWPVWAAACVAAGLAWNFVRGTKHRYQSDPRTVAIYNGPARVTLPLIQESVAQMRADRLAKTLRALVLDVQGLIDESHGVYGLHLNGDCSPWGELVHGGHYERLTALAEAIHLLDEEDTMSEAIKAATAQATEVLRANGWNLPAPGSLDEKLEKLSYTSMTYGRCLHDYTHGSRERENTARVAMEAAKQAIRDHVNGTALRAAFGAPHPVKP